MASELNKLDACEVVRLNSIKSSDPTFARDELLTSKLIGASAFCTILGSEVRKTSLPSRSITFATKVRVLPKSISLIW